MTRENKLALVVGFALILFVGILISDHFSTARNQEAATLRRISSHEPIATNPGRDIDLLPPSIKAPTPAFVEGSIPNPDSPRPEHRNSIDPNGVINMGGQNHITAYNNPGNNNGHTGVPQGFVPMTPEPEAKKVEVVFHDVRSGETLFAIARQYYGDPSLAKALGRFNNMDDPASMRIGRRLRIPAAEEIGGRTSAPVQPQQPPATSAPTQPRKAETKTYTVQKGDSLAGIAQRFLGGKGKWKKLHDMNRDVIDDPDNLKVGTVLKVL